MARVLNIEKGPSRFINCSTNFIPVQSSGMKKSVHFRKGTPDLALITVAIT